MFNEQIVYLNSKIPARVIENFNMTPSNSKKGLISPMHFHNEYEFLYITSGCLRVIIEDNEYFLYPSDILFINSRVPHSTYNYVDGTSYFMLQFRTPVKIKGPLRYVSRFKKNSDKQLYIFKQGKYETDEIVRYLQAISNYNNEKSEAYDHYITANLYMIIAFLYKTKILSEETNFEDMKLIERIMPAIEYIDTNFGEQISLESLSNVLNLNPSYFCRLFKKAIGSTFTEYLNFVRICKAEHLLKNGSSIADAAYSVGFSSLSYFNRVFKKYKFCSPREYKKISQKRENLFIDEST